MLARNSAAAEKRGWAKIPSPQPPSFLPARAEIIKIQRRDFRGKKFGFCSGQTALRHFVPQSLRLYINSDEDTERSEVPLIVQVSVPSAIYKKEEVPDTERSEVEGHYLCSIPIF